jgi:plastocyanin
MRTRYSSRLAAVLLALVAAIALAGCGSSSNSSDSSSSKKSTTASTTDTSTTDTGSSNAATQTLELHNDGNNLAFKEKTLTAKAGKVTLKLSNDSSIQHNVALEDKDGNAVGTPGELVGAGGTSETTADLKPGTYTYFCEPHKSSGMTGTLTVS